MSHDDYEEDRDWWETENDEDMWWWEHVGQYEELAREYGY